MFEVKTVSDIHILKRKLEEIDSVLFKTKVDTEETLNEVFAEDEKKQFLAYCQDNDLSAKNKSDLKKAVEDLKQRLDNVLVFNLTLSVKPTVNMLKRIEEKIQGKVDKEIALDVSVNPKIIAGTVFEVEGKYKDYSLRKSTKSEAPNTKQISNQK